MTDDSLKTGLLRGFVDRSISAEEDFVPQFLTNDPSRNEKVITSIKHEMSRCDEFMFSVAFVTFDGVNALLDEFQTLSRKGTRGRVLASQYQNFTEPRALRKLASFENIDVRIVTEDQMKMHSKCYIFRRGGYYDVVIGSSNLTGSALCSNGEWNLKFNSHGSGDVVHSITREFDRVFEHATPITDTWIEEYSLIYDDARRMRRATAAGARGETRRISPNRMQTEALGNLQALRDRGCDRALVISATGSGKTYLSAFDAKVFGGRFLYIVHRRPILGKSMESFRKVFGPDASIEEYSPATGDTGAGCVFCTVQTLSRADVLESLPRDRFDYILIDEVHHVGAPTYQRIVDHFRPRFLLGMTATPDRADGYDVYRLFDYNIAYDIRLREAMEYKLVCPFHYFGITDLEIGGRTYTDLERFSDVEEEQRVDYIIGKAEYYEYSGDRVKGLVFCRNLREAERYSALFNRRGYRTAWVSGYMDKDHVETCIERLESDGEYSLDYIFTADLFNEGVDIPAVNQVIMLRPTESPVVYIQQLGRGLRLHTDKDFVVILDFIGNYERNYYIPLALSDDRSYSKIAARRFVAAGDSVIPGNSTISFDEISKTRIYESIDASDFNSTRILYEAYSNLKAKLGRIPKLTDFKRFGSVNAMNIISRYGSYHLFLSAKEKDYDAVFPKATEDMLAYVSKIAAPGKRTLEIEVLDLLGSGCADILGTLRGRHPEMDRVAVENITAVFDGTFYRNRPALMEGGRANRAYLEAVSDPRAREQIEDAMQLGRENNAEQYADRYRDTDFSLNMMYTYDDVCRLMRWGADVNAQNIGGYKYDAKTNTFSVFINYVKGEDVLESQRYEDRFESRESLVALSKSTENRDSKNMVRVRDSVANGTRLHLFVRKNKNDAGSKEFYYLGEMTFESFVDDGKPVRIRYRLMDAVRADLYDYFNS